MPSLSEAEDRIDRLLKRVEPRTRFAEALAERTSGLLVRFDRTATGVQPAAHGEGVVLRAWGTQGWVETASSGLDEESLGRAEEALLRRIGHAGGARDPPGALSSGRGEAETVEFRPSADLPVEERLALLKTWFGWATSVEGIKNAYTLLETRSDERLYRSTAGARCLQRIRRTRGSVLALALEGGKVEYDFLGHGGTAGVEILDPITESEVTKTARSAKELLGAASPPSGRTAVLLDPSTSGTFAHESFGHGTEADQLVRDRSYLKPLLGTSLGPESISIVDDGSLKGGWGSIFFDDEGRPSQRTVLVDRGRFVEVLQDRESAAALGRRSTSNARRADFLSRPFVRMTNTLVAPGETKLDELIRSVDDGVLLESCTSGIEDPLGGNLQIKVKKGHRIRHGELGEMVSSMALSGRVLDVLRSIRGVSRSEDFEMSPGYCGKGHTDLLPTGTGGPYVLTEAVVGPA
ncbi:MAG TPA: TldD/PmbA family protein [Thermoplasmata archaeon]|nr:TldD/PmbA family protein [Thermoplasmata archaeon]